MSICYIQALNNKTTHLGWKNCVVEVGMDGNNQGLYNLARRTGSQKSGGRGYRDRRCLHGGR